jgi:exonuclease SbcD
VTRLLCTGDLHIGAGSGYADDRLGDQEAVLEQLVDVARDRDVDGVLIAGDVFDRPKPTPAELHVFARFARRLEVAGIPAVAVLGNAGHDQLGTDLPSALELFHGEWLRVSRHPEVRELAGVAICTLPSVPVSRLVAQRGGRDEVNELAVALLLETAAKLRSRAVDVPGRATLLLGHWSVSGASLPNGLPTSDLHEPVLPLEALELLGFDAMVFGHIHKPQILNQDPRPILYTGSPMTLNFGEADVEHGCWLLDVGEGGYTREFAKLTDRRFVTVDVDLTSATFAEHAAGVDETDLIAAAIVEQYHENSLADAVMRIRYRATDEQHRRVDVAALKGFCMEAGAHRVHQVTPELVRVTRLRSAGVDESLEPGAALDLWAAANELEEADRRRTRDLLTSYLEAAAA